MSRHAEFSPPLRSGAARRGALGRFAALAIDYDGTLAEQGRVEDRTWAALRRWRGAGGRVLLVTGRVREELLGILPPGAAALFDGLVLENGAVLDAMHGQRKVEVLAAPPPEALFAALSERGVPWGRGRVVVATTTDHEPAVQAALKALRLDWQRIHNGRSLMLLPSGVDKASGAVHALARLGLDPSTVIGVGDGENDLPLLNLCGLGVAVANAVPLLLERAAKVTAAPAGAGVTELIDELLLGATAR